MESGQPPDTIVWWEQRRHQRCPWCRPPRLLSLPLGMPRDISMGNKPNSKVLCLGTKAARLRGWGGLCSGKAHKAPAHTTSCTATMACPAASTSELISELSRGRSATSTSSLGMRSHAYKLRAESPTCSEMGAMQQG